MIIRKISCGQGGATSLTDLMAAYDGLPEPTRRRIEGLRAPHYTGPGLISQHMAEAHGDRWTYRHVHPLALLPCCFCCALWYE